jgi:hypothetical protein
MGCSKAKLGEAHRLLSQDQAHAFANRPSRPQPLQQSPRPYPVIARSVARMHAFARRDAAIQNQTANFRDGHTNPPPQKPRHAAAGRHPRLFISAGTHYKCVIGVALFTIYDARNTLEMWVDGGLIAFFSCFSAFMAFGTVIMFRSASGRAKLRKNPLGFVGLLAIISFSVALPSWSFFNLYRQRSDLVSGRFLETQGNIEDIYIVRGRSPTMYFEIEDRWFRLPYSHPVNCFPPYGAFTDLKFEPQADLKFKELMAHKVLWMQLTSPCEQRVW